MAWIHQDHMPGLKPVDFLQPLALIFPIGIFLAFPLDQIILMVFDPTGRLRISQWEKSKLTVVKNPLVSTQAYDLGESTPLSRKTISTSEAPAEAGILAV